MPKTIASNGRGTGIKEPVNTTPWISCLPQLAVWLNGNPLVSINIVTLHRARLVPGWVTVFGRVNYRYVNSHPGQLSLAIPPWVGALTIYAKGPDRHMVPKIFNM